MKRKTKTVQVDIVITGHAFERGKQRMGLNESAFKHLAVRAYLEGIKEREAKAPLRKFISSLCQEHSTVNNFRVYGEYIYLFNDCVLVTVFELPNTLKAFAK